MKFGAAISILVMSAFAAGAAQAQTAADAQEMLKAIVANAKAKGVAKAAEELNAGEDPAKCKDKPGISCMIATPDAKILGNGKNPKMAGMQFPPDFADVDGVPIVQQMIGPFKEGKTKWEAKYKFAAAGTKKITQQHAWCEKFDASTIVCAGLQNAGQ